MLLGSGISRKHRVILLVSLFAIAFGLVEASVVVYLRHLLSTGFNHQTHVNKEDVLAAVPGIAFLEPHTAIEILRNASILRVEQFREVATIIMLTSVALLAGNNRKQKLAYFLLAFGLWDIFYYVFLRLVIGWPTSFRSQDIFFLLPVPWAGPVIAPLVISTGLIAIALTILTRGEGTLHGPGERVKEELVGV